LKYARVSKRSCVASGSEPRSSSHRQLFWGTPGRRSGKGWKWLGKRAHSIKRRGVSHRDTHAIRSRCGNIVDRWLEHPKY
jgi:hypothetical protein